MATHEKYEPPSDETLFEFAQQVGSNLAERVNPSFARHDIVRGLADFLATIAVIEANQRNREHLFDDDEETGYADGA